MATPILQIRKLRLEEVKVLDLWGTTWYVAELGGVPTLHPYSLPHCSVPWCLMETEKEGKTMTIKKDN